MEADTMSRRRQGRTKKRKAAAFSIVCSTKRAQDTDRRTNGDTALDLADIQGFILRGYRMPMVRHFLLTVGVPAKAAKLLGRFVSGDESDAPQITTAEDWHVGFAPGPGDNPPTSRAASPTIVSTSASHGPGLVALEVKDRVPTLSFKSFGAFMAGAAERAALVGDTAQARRRTGSAVSGKETITSY